MKFNLKKRQGSFGVFNNRRENEGQVKAKVKAIDLPVLHKVTPAELDMICPLQDGKLSEVIWNKKGKLNALVISPMKIHRHPEGLQLVIYDNDLKPDQAMTFEDVSAKDITAEYDDDFTCYVSYKLQIHPGKLLARIDENVEAQNRHFSVKSTRPELFDQDVEGENDDGRDEQRDIEDAA